MEIVRLCLLLLLLLLLLAAAAAVVVKVFFLAITWQLFPGVKYSRKTVC